MASTATWGENFTHLANCMIDASMNVLNRRRVSWVRIRSRSGKIFGKMVDNCVKKEEISGETVRSTNTNILIFLCVRHRHVCQHTADTNIFRILQRLWTNDSGDAEPEMHPVDRVWITSTPVSFLVVNLFCINEIISSSDGTWSCSFARLAICKRNEKIESIVVLYDKVTNRAKSCGVANTSTLAVRYKTFDQPCYGVIDLRRWTLQETIVSQSPVFRE